MFIIINLYFTKLIIIKFIIIIIIIIKLIINYSIKLNFY
jgi:hypothetical protein